jgi:1-acyl-sn-glycerol-3-phosphate acyltransferase
MPAAARAEAEARERRASGSRPATPLALPACTPASARPSGRSRLRRMPRWLRIVLTGWCFAIFFSGTCTLGVLAGLWFRFARVPDEERGSFMRRINVSLRLFAGLMRDVGLIDYWPPRLPEGYEGRPFLLVANHPTLIDVVLLLSSLPELSCLVKASWYRSFLMGPMLRRTEYIPGPGHEGDEDEADLSPVMRRMEEKLRAGVPVLVFPEGTRSAAKQLRRFHRGSVEAAIRAGVPILPLFIGNTQAFLMKGQPFWHVPVQTCDYYFEWLEPIDTAGRALDSREVTRELAARYEARFAKLLEERERASA